MAALRPLAYRIVKKKLEAAGFEERVGRGSHRKFVKLTAEGVITAIVPEHREIAVGTLRSIIRQAMLTPEEFEETLATIDSIASCRKTSSFHRSPLWQNFLHYFLLAVWREC